MHGVVVLLFSYLVGAIPFGYIISKLYKKDIRKLGSGNIGVTNVLRTLGKIPAGVVLFFDMTKGIVPVILGFQIGQENLAVFSGICAMLGHTYPIYIGFKGGKGIATGAGVMLALAPDITLVAVLVFVLSVTITKYVSLGSLLSVVTVCSLMFIWHKPIPYMIFGISASILVIYRHRENIKRLLNGTEYKIGQKIDS